MGRRVFDARKCLTEGTKEERLLVPQRDCAPFRFQLLSFEAGTVEKVGGRDANVVTYAVAGLPAADWNVTLWIDTETGLPLKRVVDPLGGESFRITETYQITLNRKVGAGDFQLPR
jgi:hypothetical protein